MNSNEEVIYNGRRIYKNHFRAFIYGQEDAKKLVNSWDEYESHISTGIWFPSKDKVISKPKQKPKTKRESSKTEITKVHSEVIEQDIISNEAGA